MGKHVEKSKASDSDKEIELLKKNLELMMRQMDDLKSKNKHLEDKLNEINTPDEKKVQDPGDCVGHWDKCPECESCELQDCCMDMTNNIAKMEEE